MPFCFPGTWVNEVRLQPGVKWELSDGDTLIFGGQSAPGSPEFYFLFQKVKVRPLDFDAITIPKVIREVCELICSDKWRNAIQGLCSPLDGAVEKATSPQPTNFSNSVT